MGTATELVNGLLPLRSLPGRSILSMGMNFLSWQDKTAENPASRPFAPSSRIAGGTSAKGDRVVDGERTDGVGGFYLPGSVGV